MWVTVFVAFFMALGAYLIADGLIGSQGVRDSFIKAGMAGKDMNKKEDTRM